MHVETTVTHTKWHQSLIRITILWYYSLKCSVALYEAKHTAHESIITQVRTMDKYQMYNKFVCTRNYVACEISSNYRHEKLPQFTGVTFILNPKVWATISSLLRIIHIMSSVFYLQPKSVIHLPLSFGGILSDGTRWHLAFLSFFHHPFLPQHP